LIHRDFHPGNVLWSYNNVLNTKFFITDLGLSRPANEKDKEGKIYGVLPYVAPEVLLEKGYTKSADIYSFGMVAYEVLSGLPPYYDLPHDHLLGKEICCKGLRPQFQIKIPQLLEDLIKRCWNANPSERPTANELHEVLTDWFNEIYWERNTEFYQQYRETKKFNQEFNSPMIDSSASSYQTHFQAVYTSRLLPTKEIVRLSESSPEQSFEQEIKKNWKRDKSNTYWWIKRISKKTHWN